MIFEYLQAFGAVEATAEDLDLAGQLYEAIPEKNRGGTAANVISAYDAEGEALAEAMRQRIREKDGNLKGNMASQGTTPRRYTDLLGSLCDLTSGSGDRGTPVVLIQGYFTNFATE